MPRICWWSLLLMFKRSDLFWVKQHRCLRAGQQARTVLNFSQNFPLGCTGGPLCLFQQTKDWRAWGSSERRSNFHLGPEVPTLTWYHQPFINYPKTSNLQTMDAGFMRPSPLLSGGWATSDPASAGACEVLPEDSLS